MSNTYGIVMDEQPRYRHQLDSRSTRGDRSLCGKPLVIVPNATLYTDDCVLCLEEQVKRSN
ncbi:hypothetical protein ACFXPX_13925 [Kitasatospora sp. NPDC059146]|uniref:hypothetical protein n=1 Tax=unclassified Kitasatospora TaxID=2633591 RepID=UPI0036CE939D